MENIRLRAQKSVMILMALIFCLASPSLGWAKSTEEKIEKAIDSAAEKLKEAVEKVGGDIAAVQNYLDNYQWKGVIQEEARSGVVKLKELKLNGHKRAVVVKPGERIEGEVDAHMYKEECSSLEFYRVVIGIKGQGGQTTICNCLGAVAGKSVEKFVLIAPSETGVYEIRFRPVAKYLESDALKAWVDAQGQEPDAKTTIGIIFVKS